MTISPEKNKSLKALNTFGVDQRAELFLQVSSEPEIEDAVRFSQLNQLPLFVLGGGSNLLIVKDIPGLVIQPVNQSIEITPQSEDVTLVSAAAGVIWHSLVQYTLNADIPGLENLSLIPGSVGAAPVQNIGAYGVEVKERIAHVRALHRPTMQWHTLSAEQCNFSYRHSLFKDKPNEYIISEVCFSLGFQHAPQTSYATLAQHLKSRNISYPTALQISESVIAIRSARLPDPAIIGNAGSFFHNPVVNADKHASLLATYPELVSYPQHDGSFKLAAGWLIDNLGLKGAIRGDVGVHDTQALVLVNRGGGTGADILALADEIRLAVFDTYGVKLAIEPRILG